ncbi:putative bifunctional diguanylate cyclase/phosphodiesterase [Pseudomonas oryzihabitans]|uniref:putative bifunctional diguanylate cyclase/phosphodiesterase n=1 Tax=Pseudomonas oryzihabitans TaxID=47885 RepID=UPI002B1DD8A0|nr:EAL domain-containing protein [Pseudomonas oryzihabitans]
MIRPSDGTLAEMDALRQLEVERSARQRTERSLNLMASAFALCRDAMAVLSESGQIIEANEALCRLMLSAGKSVSGQYLSHYIKLPEAAIQAFERHGYALSEASFHVSAKRATPMEISLSRFAGEGGAEGYVIASLRDITERKRAEQALERLALSDGLTQLPNRSGFYRRFEDCLRGLAPDRSLAVLFIDVDGFKEVNDSLGHETGDELLKTLGASLQDSLGEGELLARWGGDEFVAAVAVDSRSQARQIAERLLQVVGRPQRITEHDIRVSASIGLSLSPEDGQNAETLLSNADAAMYAAKSAGKSRARFYDPEFTAEALRKVTLLAHLHAAIEAEEIKFVLQPKFDAQRRLVSAELLARWECPGVGVVLPSVFVALAEQNGMASSLGRLAIRRAAAYARDLQRAGVNIPVAVNISARQVADDELGLVLERACTEFGVRPRALELEVTESVFLQRGTPERRLGRLRDQGFRVAMDDFGTGYSSLSYLHRLSFDTIKIDRSFLLSVDRDARSRQLLAGIVSLCRALNMQIVAEGVETQAQFELLKSLGVDTFQGFLLGRPQSLESLLLLAGATDYAPVLY